MSASDYLEGKILDHVFGLASYTAPANLYVALFTAAPNDAGGGTEVSGNAYARVQVTNSSATWTRTTSTISNSIDITFPAPTPSDWGTLTHFAVFDASSGGNQIGWSSLTAPTSTSAETAVKFTAGALTITAE
jgi:hypothetical protein